MNVIHRALSMTLAATVLFLAGCSGGPAAPDSRSAQMAQQDIQDMHAALLKGYNAKDSAAVSSYYTDDAILMPPNLVPVKSRIAVTEFMRQTLVPPMNSMLMNVAETVVSGDYAFSTGFYTMLKADGTTLDEGKFVEILKNDSGKWLIYRDIYNSDMAATAAPAAATH